MTRHDSTLPLLQMLERARDTSGLLQAVPRPEDQRLDDLALQGAVSMLAAAAVRVPSDVQQRWPEVPWSELASWSEHLTVHYDAVDQAALRRFVVGRLQPAIRMLEDAVVEQKRLTEAAPPAGRVRGDLPISMPTPELADFCRKHGIRRMALFGSVLRDDFAPGSDVDMLVEFEPGARVSFFDLVAVEEGLSRLLGRKVDLHQAKSLHPYLRDKVLKEAREVYAAA